MNTRTRTQGQTERESNREKLLKSIKLKHRLMDLFDFLSESNAFVVILIPMLTSGFLFWFLDITNITLCKPGFDGYQPILGEGTIRGWFYFIYLCVIVGIYLIFKIIRYTFGSVSDKISSTMSLEEIYANMDERSRR